MLIWKCATLALTLQSATAHIATTTVEPDGTQTTTTETLGKIVTIARISAAEGTQLLVKDGTVKPIGAGQVTTSTPLVDTINSILSWISLALLFIAGLFLYCCSGKTKKERAAKPEPDPMTLG
jgi:hypothetical protein